MSMYTYSPITYYRPHFSLETSPIRVGALPVRLFQDTVAEFERSKHLPPTLAYLSAIAALAIAMQNLLDVLLPNGRKSPTSMMLVGVGAALSGKTTAGDYFLQCIQDFETLNCSRLPGDGFLYKDTTGAALYAGLAQLPTAGLVSYEGSGILKDIVRKEAHRLNELWSGEPIKIRRVTTKSVMLNNARLTMLIMVHPGHLQEFLSKFGGDLGDIGFLARLMVAHSEDPSSLPPGPEFPIPEPFREAFSNRIRELLEQNLEAASNPQFERKVVQFTPSAARIWLDYSAQLKSDARPGGRFELAPEHAGRLAENVARIAALLHYFEGFEGDIDESTLYAAMVLAESYSRNFMGLFVPEISEELDAHFLDEWMSHHFRNKPLPVRWLPRSDLRRRAPNRLRNNAILDPLIDLLVSRCRIAQFKKNGAWHLDLMPWLGQPIPSGQPARRRQAGTSAAPWETIESSRLLCPVCTPRAHQQLATSTTCRHVAEHSATFALGVQELSELHQVQTVRVGHVELLHQGPLAHLLCKVSLEDWICFLEVRLDPILAL